ncbi:hypothetical protein LJR296_008128 [Cupriavidus necator]|uniref:hypothetical protein n=1 Tax=Cupriavidus necator TaxID=106590 RepID=UPI003ED10C1E
MIKCIKPDHYQPHGAWEMSNGRVVKPAIVILNPQKVYPQLERRRAGFEANPQRLATVMKIPENGWLELPEIWYVHDEVVFKQGRHRTAALATLGFASYPVVTVDSHAPRLLAKFGASICEARTHFDWGEIEDYPVMGI